MRIFIAIDIPEEVRRELAAFQGALKRQPASVGWTEPRNMHLTLKFLGETEERTLSAIREAALAAAECCRPLTLTLRGSGVFPNARNPRVLWVGLGGDIEPVVRLAAAIDERMAGCGFERESRSYSPHITIGRFKSPIGARELLSAAYQYPLAPLSFRIEELIVMQSQLKPGGAVYTPIARCPLGLTRMNVQK